MYLPSRDSEDLMDLVSITALLSPRVLGGTKSEQDEGDLEANINVVQPPPTPVGKGVLTGP